MLQSSVYLIVLIDPDVATIAMTGIHLRFQKKYNMSARGDQTYHCSAKFDGFLQNWRISKGNRPNLTELRPILADRVDCLMDGFPSISLDKDTDG